MAAMNAEEAEEEVRRADAELARLLPTEWLEHRLPMSAAVYPRRWQRMDPLPPAYRCVVAASRLRSTFLSEARGRAM